MEIVDRRQRVPERPHPAIPAPAPATSSTSSAACENERGRTPIVPLVFYHGRSAWRVPTDFRALVRPAPGTASYVPRFSYLLTDLARIADHEIRGSPPVRVPLLLLLHIFDEGFRLRARVILKPLGGIGDAGLRIDVTRACLNYIMNARDDLTTDDLEEIARDVLPGDEGERIMPTLADRLREEGRQQGAAGAVRDAVVEVLETRFGTLTDPLRERIHRVEDLAALRRLHRAALTTESLEAFREELEGAS